MLGENVERLPMQGLPARPRAVADPTPPELANFGDEAARNTARAGAMARGALVGAAATTLEAGAHLGPILPLCVLVAPLCIGVVAAGAAVGASQSALTAVPQEQANRLADIAQRSAAEGIAARAAALRVRAPAEAPEYPRVAVRVESILLVPLKEGITFRVAVSARGSPSADLTWEPSIHFTQLPTRTVEEWLRADGTLLKSDLAQALGRLGHHIGTLYLPYEQRGR
jgi:hypothetical protein